MGHPEHTLAGDREQITELLFQLRNGDTEAGNRLYSLVYQDLRRIAHRQLRNERPGHSFSTTDLVHETYLRLVDQTRVEWQDRSHYFRIAAWAMRRVLVDYARRYRTARRGGALQRVSLDEEAAATERGETLLALDEALERLATVSGRLSQVVECRFFGGLSEQETADALGLTLRTVQRDWAKARVWLHLNLGSV
jgi:RNA polymerase sigma factor (TIGR02999 family)